MKSILLVVGGVVIGYAMSDVIHDWWVRRLL